MKVLILEIRKGGLGDHLFYSHIPRIVKETAAYDKIYISNRSWFRSQDTKRLVWDTNSYLDGFCDSGGIFPEDKANFHVREDENLLDRIMLELGIDDGKRFHEPEVGYVPPLLPQLSGTTVYDPNYITWTGGFNKSDLSYFLQDRHICIDYQMKIRRGIADAKEKRRFKSIPVKGARELACQSLEEFCSIIVSCQTLYCLTTGTATLAAALGKPVKVLYGAHHEVQFRHSPLHEYIFIDKRPLTFIELQYFRIRNVTRRILRTARRN